MAITLDVVAKPKTGHLRSEKVYSLVATDQLVIRKNAADDSDLDYTVPASKKATVRVVWEGFEYAA